MKTFKTLAIVLALSIMACSSDDKGAGISPGGGGSGGSSSCKEANFLCESSSDCCEGLVCPEAGFNQCCYPEGFALPSGKTKDNCCSRHANADRVCEGCHGAGQSCNQAGVWCCSMFCDNVSWKCCVATGMGRCTEDWQCCDGAPCHGGSCRWN